MQKNQVMNHVLTAKPLSKLIRFCSKRQSVFDEPRFFAQHELWDQAPASKVSRTATHDHSLPVASPYRTSKGRGDDKSIALFCDSHQSL